MRGSNHPLSSLPDRIRLLEPGDAAAASGVIHAAFSAQSVPTDPPSSALRETVETVARQIAEGGGACAEMDGVLMGVVLWAEQADGLYLGRLAVRPEYRGRGLARLLIAATEREARRRGLARVHLSTRLALMDNRRLFAACGYQETDLHSHPGYDRPTFVAMEKYLLPGAEDSARRC